MNDAEVVSKSGNAPSLRILMAEDNITNQKLLVFLLLRAGHKVDVAADGEEAIEAFGAHPYDLVLMDINMPKMNGIAAMQHIRERGGTGATIPIIAVTAKAMKGDRERYLAAGMNDYVSKPIMESDLHEAIARHCGAMAE